MSTTPEKPTPLSVQPEGIPAELCQYPQWVGWRYEWDGKNDRWTKMPRVVGKDRNAKSDDPTTWCDYDPAIMSFDPQTDAGIAFMFSEDDPYFGVDIDACRNPETGELTDWAAQIVERLDTYWEVSPSGYGIKAIGRGTLPVDVLGKSNGKVRTGKSYKIKDVPTFGDKAPEVAFYDKRRFWTMTGRRVEGTPAGPQECQSVVNQLFAEYWPTKRSSAKADIPNGHKANGYKAPEADGAIIARMTAAKNGEAVEALWCGKWEGKYPSQSEADAALCSHLAFWCGPDAERIDRIFRGSGLYRDKWDRDDYRERTIAGAIEKTKEFYNWGRASQQRSVRGRVSTKPDKGSEIRQAEEALTGLDSLSAEAAFGDEIIAPMATLYRLDRAAYERHKLRLPAAVSRRGFEAAVKQHPAAQIKVDEKSGLTKPLADLICADNHFAQDAGGKLYRYSGGVYRPRGEQYVKTQVKRFCLEKGWEWTKHQAEECVEYIRVDSPELWERPAEGHINVRNGLLNWRTKELKDHTHEHLTVVQLPVKYDPDATCPQIDKFIGETFPPDSIDLAYEIPASSMTGHQSIQKAILLTGRGGEGKSRYLAMVKALLGKSNVSGLSLHRLESNQFAAARLYGKLANICPDLPSEHLAGTSVFKAIVDSSSDTIVGEHKFKDSFDFTPFCRLLFSANHPPRSEDSSEGFFDRWLVVPFGNRFRGEGGEISAAKLDAMLSAPAELSGLLNKALDALTRLYRSGHFAESETTLEAHKEFRAMTDPLSVWLDANTIDDPTMYVGKTVLRTRYNIHANNRGLPSMTGKSMTAALERIRPQLGEAQRVVNNKTAWCYMGIGLKSDDDEREKPLF